MCDRGSPQGPSARATIPRLRTADARWTRLAGPHREFISIDPEEERIAIIWKGNGGYWTVDLELVSDLELLAKNGDKRRR